MTTQYRITWTADGQSGSTPYHYPERAANAIAELANELAPHIRHAAEPCPPSVCELCHGTGLLSVRGPTGLMAVECTCKSVSTHKCEDCGSTENLEFGPCPFNQEINGVDDPVWLCHECIKNRFDDI